MSELNPQDWFKSLGTLPALTLVALAFSPSILDWAVAPPTEWKEYQLLGGGYSQLMLPSVVLVGFVATRTNIAGPLRYGAHNYGPWMKRVWSKSPEWAIPVLVVTRLLLPGTQVWLLALATAAWQYTYQHFREAVRSVADQVGSVCASASIAAGQAREDAAQAVRLEYDALSNAAFAFRDARNAQLIRASDFFDGAMTAWAAVKRAADATGAALGAAGEAVKSADGAVGHANSANSYATSYAASYSAVSYSSSVVASASSLLSSANSCEAQAKHARDSLETARSEALMAQESVLRSERAVRQDAEARNAAKRNTVRVAKSVGEITALVRPLPSAAARLAERAEKLRYDVSCALAAAEEGRMAEAIKMVAVAKTELAAIEAESKRIVGEKEKARIKLVGQILEN